MSLVEQALGAYVAAVLLGSEEVVGAEVVGAEVVGAEVVEELEEADSAEIVDAEVIDAEVIDAEVIDAEPDAVPSRFGEEPPVADLSDAALLERLAAYERTVAALQAKQVEVLAEFGRRRAAEFPPDDDVPLTARRHRQDFAADELTARLRWTTWTALHRLDEAERLAACLPRTWTALAEGRVDYPRVRRIVNATRMLREDDAAAVDEAVADRAEGLTTAQLDALLAAEVAAVDPAAAERRAAAATASRRVAVEPRPDGQALLLAEGPAVDVLAIMRGLTKAAGERLPGDDRGIDARRFDALRDWAYGVLAGSDVSGATSCAGRPAWRPHVLITVALSTVLGLDDDPGHLHGYGPIPAHVARQAAAEGTLKRLLTDPVTGLVVGVDGHTYPGGLVIGPAPGPGDDDGHGDPPPPRDPGPGGGGGPRGGGPGPGESRYGASGFARSAPGSLGGPPPSERPAAADRPAGAPRAPVCAVLTSGGGEYRPGRSLDRFVRYRDVTCTGPGCRRRAEACDLDHIVRYPDGPTCPCNLHPLCRRHHRMKHLAGVTVRRLPTGETEWTMPTGYVFTRPPNAALHRPLVRRRHRDTDEVVPDVPVCAAGDRAADGVEALRAAVEGEPVEDDRPALEVRERDRRAGSRRQSWAEGPPPF